ncbi:TonB-dependent siderophore receptor [Cyanobacterium aponinum UTEX 3222]|uniref:TonB-dependent siderophore receptor n=1 Tax=Cyanobacterium aponinum TaxID=379064 RepID=UPI00308F2DC6|nr:TonB-dependent siderophore receptor [Cyanobacterium aponinum UTEX 3222]
MQLNRFFLYLLPIVNITLLIDISVKAEESKVVRLSEIEPIAQKAELLLAQEIVEIRGIKLEPSDTGLQIIIETESLSKLQPLIYTRENTLIIDVLDVVLALSDGEEFRAENPSDEISEIRATPLDNNGVRIIVKGKMGIPTAQVVPSESNLVLSLTAGDTATSETEIEVVATQEGQEDTGYFVPDTSTATRTETPLQDIPQSIQVIPQQVLRDQRSDISGALQNAPSVRVSSPTNFDTLRIQVRGFFTSPTLNGFKDSLSSTLGPDLTGIDRIEVLQGPNSVLFGSSSPGGTVNFVTKQPLSDPYYFAEATFGNYNFYRGEIDISGPLDDSGKVLGRLNASYRDQGFFTDFSNTKNLVIAPAVSVQLGDNTKITIEGIYKDLEFTSISYGLPVVGTIESNPNGQIPLNRNVNEGTLDADGSRIGYALEHQFNENWSIRNAFQHTRYFSSYSDPNGATFPVGLLPDNRTLERVYFTADYDQRDSRMSTNIVGKFATGSVKHQLLFGFDLGRQTIDSNGVDREVAPLDLFNPVYNDSPGAITFEYNDNTVTDELGFILQDQVTISDNLIFLISGRFDTFEQTYKDFLANTQTNQSGSAFSPRVGVVYKPIQPISLYANYSRSFEPAIGQAVDGSDFEPTRGTQFEIGVKGDIHDKLSATLAFYHITQSNVLTADNNNPGFSVQTGEQRSQGVELGVAGEILPGWNIFASYAYNDAEVTEDNSIPVGNRVQRTTPNAFSLWTTYQIQEGNLEGLGFGLGLFYVDNRAGDAQNTFEVPSYFRTDAAIFYEKNQFRAALNFKNLFDVNYYENAFGRLRVSPGEPFTVQGTISWKF